MCKVNVCQCVSGFVRHENGNCVQLSQCSPRPMRDTEPACSPNEKFQNCGTACEPSCDNPSPDFCTEQCILDVCQCASGFVRNNKHQCVRQRECRSPRDVPVCGQNEQFSECSTCERTCDTPNPKCTRECKPPKCQCSPGFLRNPEGICVPQDKCSAAEINPCTFTECIAGRNCIAVPSPCLRPPCPLTAVCVNVCKDHKCPRDQHCVLQNVVCVRAPCPPRPTCVKNESSSGTGSQSLDSRPIDPTGADVENPLEQE
ncbi:trypsin inhibitor like cysteine rich domain-containing protein [Ditylenchus destructor]|nr:trypsin inhibitor like cysteine rich domain-containing protein [Ditylenchus destructor]